MASPLSCLRRMCLQYLSAAEHEPCGEGGAVGVGDEFERRHGLRNPEVRPFPFGDAAVRCLQSHGVGAFRVAALKASCGFMRSLMQASDTMNFMLPEGDEPGLKSEAMATPSPASIILRTGG